MSRVAASPQASSAIGDGTRVDEQTRVSMRNGRPMRSQPQHARPERQQAASHRTPRVRSQAAVAGEAARAARPAAPAAPLSPLAQRLLMQPGLHSMLRCMASRAAYALDLIAADGIEAGRLLARLDALLGRRHAERPMPLLVSTRGRPRRSGTGSTDTGTGSGSCQLQRVSSAAPQ